MRDVAIRAGVSPATVSNVLGDRKPVDPVLAERVRQAARDLNYQIDRAASQLRSGRARVICVSVPSLENPFFTALIAGVERAVRPEGYDIIIASGNDDEEVERHRMQALLSWRPAGVVIVPTTDRFAVREILEGAHVPFVVADRVTEASAADSVMMDNAAAGAMAARHLLDLGHRDVLVVASTLRIGNIRERCAGIAEVYAAAGLEAPSLLEVGLSFEEIGERLERRFADDGRPSGVIALTNYATMGVIDALRRLSIAVPGDVSLIGFDDYTWMRVASPPITAVAQPVGAMAEEAWAALRARIEGSDAPPRRVRLPCTLEIRQSTRAVGPPIPAREAATAPLAPTA